MFISKSWNNQENHVHSCLFCIRIVQQPRRTLTFLSVLYQNHELKKKTIHILAIPPSHPLQHQEDFSPGAWEMNFPNKSWSDKSMFLSQVNSENTTFVCPAHQGYVWAVWQAWNGIKFVKNKMYRTPGWKHIWLFVKAIDVFWIKNQWDNDPYEIWWVFIEESIKE